MHNIYFYPLSISNQSLLVRILNELKKIFNSHISIIDLNLDVESTRSIERNQYYSTKIIAEVLNHSTEYDGKILVLVDFDLYIPIFTYVFGEAQLNGKVSIVSLCRLYEEFYTGISNDELLFQRAMKEILHEIGHSFGLIHCSNWDCVMHSSAGIEEVDIKGNFYCKDCALIIDEHINHKITL